MTKSIHDSRNRAWGKWVQAQRKSLGINLRKLSILAKCHQSYLTKIESGYVPERWLVENLGEALVQSKSQALVQAGYLPPELTGCAMALLEERVVSFLPPACREALCLLSSAGEDKQREIVAVIHALVTPR